MALRRSSLSALAVALCLGTTSPLLTAFDVAAQEQRPNCANFLDQVDAQVAFDVDPSDPFGLDESGEGNGQACEQPEGEFGSQRPLINCDDLQNHPDIARALYDHALSKYDADRYELAACVEQERTSTDPSRRDRANGGRRGDDPEVLDGTPGDTEGSAVIVSTGALGTGESLEARLEARFAVLEAQFAAFEERATNGFGRFPESGDEVTAGRPSTTVIDSASQQPITMSQRTTAHADSPVIRAQKAKDSKGHRTEERKIKRDRHKSKHRNQR